MAVGIDAALTKYRASQVLGADGRLADRRPKVGQGVMLRHAVHVFATYGDEPGSMTVMSLAPTVAEADGVKLNESWVDDTPKAPCEPPTSVPETKTFAPVLNPE